MEEYIIEICYTYGHGTAGKMRINLREFLPCATAKLSKIKAIYMHSIYSSQHEMLAVHNMKKYLDEAQEYYHFACNLKKEAQCVRCREYLEKWEAERT